MEHSVYYMDIDEIPGQRFLGLIFYSLCWHFPPSSGQIVNKAFRFARRRKYV